MSRPVLEIRTSPHVRSGASVDRIMLNVVLALLPATGFAVYAFGLTALCTLSVAVITCVAFEHLLCKLSRKPTTVGDWSAVITGLLYGLTLPPGLPMWMVCVGGLIAIGVGKHLFGGLGFNTFNPALVGRAILQATFPVPMTTWVEPMGADRLHTVVTSSLALPFSRPEVDAVTSATPLAAWKFDQELAATSDLVMGYTSGSVGETGALFILAGGLWLVARNMMNWRIPVSVLATVAALAGLLHLVDPAYPPATFMLFAGGLMLGATFMASDMVGSPMTHGGCVIYGVLIGALVVVIRLWAGMPEGVMYAILLGNATTPHIDGWLRPRVFGTRRRAGEEGDA